ncbi:hypothetical protein [Bacteroides sp.]
MFDKIVECLATLLPFLRKKETAKEFSELITSQYGFLMVQLEKALKDYFDLSSKVKEMHAEIFSLREQRCRVADCELRK